AAGVNVLEFNPINPLTAQAGWDVNQRDHRKLLIVDGRVAFLGGINISSVYSSSAFSKRPKRPKRQSPQGKLPWRDTQVELEGPVVADFQRLFLGTWAKQNGDALAPRRYFPTLAAQGKEIVRAIGSSPDEPYSLMYATLISAIRSAETSVHLTFAYFAPDKQMLRALEATAARGVDVRIILPSTTDSGLVFNAGRSYYTELLRAGVKIYELRDALLHAKTAVIDDVWSTIGSTNLDWRSFLHNDEINAVILGPVFGAQMHAVFEADMAASNRILLDQWEKRPLSLRIKERAARIWAYWL
ncbi:MAG: phospholipase D-like domain-containing protein, partial [Betaproteobacteria bacterium]